MEEENSREKMAKIEFFMKWALVATIRVRTMNKLEEACANGDDQIIFVRNCSGNRVMIKRGFGRIC